MTFYAGQLKIIINTQAPTLWARLAGMGADQVTRMQHSPFGWARCLLPGRTSYASHAFHQMKAN